MAAADRVKIIANDQQFQAELNNAGSKLVVVDFTASWNLDAQWKRRGKPLETARKQGVSVMPTFQLFKVKVKVDELKGAKHKRLEEKIKKWIGDDDSGVKGHVNLATFIDKSGCECLNVDDEHQLSDVLTKGPGYLESDCDEQILISLAFDQVMKLHSLKLQAPDDGRGPKTVKLFINQPSSMDFDSAEQFEPVQTIELGSDDIKEDVIIPLKYVKLQYVQNVTLFVKDNQGGEETSVINYLCFIGSPLDTMNMGDFIGAEEELSDSDDSSSELMQELFSLITSMEWDESDSDDSSSGLGDETVTLGEQTSADNNTDLKQGKLEEQKQSDETQASKVLGLEKMSTVDSKGGLSELGDCSLTIPSGSLCDSQNISITLEDPVQFYGVFDDVGLFPCIDIASPVIKLGPSGLQFTHPSLLEAKLYRQARDDEEITVLCGHHAQSEEESTKIMWADVTGQCTIDEDCQTISIHIQHFSWFFVLYKSVVIGANSLISRLNFTTFKYHVAVYIKPCHSRDTRCDLRVAFMSSDIYREPNYSKQQGSILARLEEEEYEFLCDKEGSYVYSGQELTLWLMSSAECSCDPEDDGVREIAVNASAWWSSGDEVSFTLQHVECREFVNWCVELEEGEVTLRVKLDANSCCKYITNAFKLGHFANLLPLAKFLDLSEEEKRCLVINKWKDDREQLLELLNVRFLSKPDETSQELKLTLSNIDLMGEQHISRRGQMHVANLRRLKESADSTIDDGSSKEGFINERTKDQLKSFLHDCCIQTMTSCETMKALDPEQCLIHLVKKDYITEEVYQKLCEWLTTASTRGYMIIAQLIPVLIQMTKEIFVTVNEPSELNGMWGLLLDDRETQNILSDTKEAIKNNDSAPLIGSICEIFARLCLKNEKLLETKTGLSKEKVEKWRLWRNLEELLNAVEVFMRIGEASKTKMRIVAKGNHLCNILERKERGKHLVCDLGDLVSNVIEFAKFDPSHLVRFTVKRDSAAVVPVHRVTYNSNHRVFAQNFQIVNTQDCDISIFCNVEVNLDGKEETLGTIKAEIISNEVVAIQNHLMFKDQPVKLIPHKSRNRLLLHGTCEDKMFAIIQRLKQEFPCKISHFESSENLKLVGAVEIPNGSAVPLILLYHWGDHGISHNEGEGLTIAYEHLVPAELSDSSALALYDCTEERQGACAVEGGCTSQNGGGKILQYSAISCWELELFATDLSFPVAKEEPIEEHESGGALVVTSEIEEYSKTAEPEHVVKDIESYLNVDCRALQSPSEETCRKIRSFSNYLKTMKRQDIVAQIKRCLPSAAGPLVPEEMLLRDMKYSVLGELSIALTGEGWQKLADYLGMKVERIMFLERLPNPGLSILQMCAIRDLTAGQLYDILVACGLEMLADKI